MPNDPTTVAAAGVPDESHGESHRLERVGWLRAAVLGANDGIVSTASLLAGVASAGAERSEVLLAGVAGLVAGAMSMASGEYVSVYSQTDAEKADIARERAELLADPESELAELKGIYVARGLSDELAGAVAEQLTARDALAAHVRDELGITEITVARPLQAALASAASFAVGAALPLAVAAATAPDYIVPSVVVSALASLAALGALGAGAGGAAPLRAALRVTLWGALAMAATSLVGRLFGTVV